ncbi:hypothetical protein ACFV9C_42790 [Kribbella sp. NPDC059898]|uniref:hypothetical protein n=1 Tax=Kribbella sp. NPDC059898 TaxID=3346995 RepID=UPI0036633D38
MASSVAVGNASGEVRDAADRWDAAEKELLTLDDEFRTEAGYAYDDWNAPELHDIVNVYAADAKAWMLNHLGDHKSGTYDRHFLAPAAMDTDAEIEQQNKPIREVAQLAGEPGA